MFSADDLPPVIRAVCEGLTEATINKLQGPLELAIGTDALKSLVAEVGGGPYGADPYRGMFFGMKVFEIADQPDLVEVRLAGSR